MAAKRLRRFGLGRPQGRIDLRNSAGDPQPDGFFFLRALFRLLEKSPAQEPDGLGLRVWGLGVWGFRG